MLCPTVNGGEVDAPARALLQVGLNLGQFQEFFSVDVDRHRALAFAWENVLISNTCKGYPTMKGLSKANGVLSRAV